MIVAERWINGEQGGELRFEAVEEVLLGEAELEDEQLLQGDPPSVPPAVWIGGRSADSE